LGAYALQATTCLQESSRVATAAAKVEIATEIVAQHGDDRALVFTADNLAAYARARQLALVG